MSEDDRAAVRASRRPPTIGTTSGHDDTSGAISERRFVVDAATADLRMDQFVAQKLGESAAAARKRIAAGQVRVGSRVLQKGTRLASGMTVSVIAEARPTAHVIADPTVMLSIVFEDSSLIAVDKPPGQPSHPLRAGERGTAANGIVARFPECALASRDPREGGLGHRLDNATSGVLIAARSRTAWLALRRALGAEDCDKTYLCEVWGAPAETGKNDKEIGRRGRRAATVHVGGGRGSRAATTSWRVLERRGNTALLEAHLHAGRAHQVRAHLADAGFPLVGDDRYGGSIALGGEAQRSLVAGRDGGSMRLHLHAAAVRFRHPITQQMVIIEAPAPTWASKR